MASIAFSQNINVTTQLNMKQRRAYVDTLLKLPSLNTFRTFATGSTNGVSVDSIGQILHRPDSNKVFVRYNGGTMKAIAIEDSIRALRYAINTGGGGGSTPTLNAVMSTGNTSSHVLNLTSGSLDVADGLNLFNGSEDIVLQKRLSGSAVSELRLASNGSIQLSPGPSSSPMLTITGTSSTFAGNVSSTGTSTFSRSLLYQPNNAGFNKYQMLGFTATDTSGLWEWGISGVAQGAPLNGGGALVLRSHLTTGAVSNDLLSLPRLSSGITLIRSVVTLGTGTPTISGNATLTVLGGSNINGTTRIAGDIRYSGAFYETSDVVITADYDATNTGVQYIYVNATDNVTITLPVPTTSPFSKGRVIHIKKIIDNAATVTLVCNLGATNIEFGSSYIFTTYKQSVTLRDDGTQWFVH